MRGEHHSRRLGGCGASFFSGEDSKERLAGVKCLDAGCASNANGTVTSRALIRVIVQPRAFRKFFEVDRRVGETNARVCVTTLGPGGVGNYDRPLDPVGHAAIPTGPPRLSAVRPAAVHVAVEAVGIPVDGWFSLYRSNEADSGDRAQPCRTRPLENNVPNATFAGRERPPGHEL